MNAIESEQGGQAGAVKDDTNETCPAVRVRVINASAANA